MAGGNRKGPDDRSSMSGRGVGYCAGYDRLGYDNPDVSAGERPGGGRLFGRGRGFSAGSGRGNRGGGFRSRNRFWPRRNFDNVPEGEKEWLQNRAEALQSELENINTRINHLSGAPSEEETGENK